MCTFVAGVALYTLGRGIYFFNNFGKRFYFHLSDHKFGVLLIGRTFMKCYLLIVFTVALFQATPLVGSSGKIDLISNITSIPMLFLGYPVVVFLFLSFIFVQLSIHRKLQQSKKDSVREIEEKLRQIYLSSQDYDKENIELLYFFRQELHKTLKMPEWPCSIKNFLGGGVVSMLGALLPPTIKTVLDALNNYLEQAL